MRAALGVSATPNGQRIPFSPVKTPVIRGIFAQFYSGLNFTGTFTGTDATFLGTPDEL